MRKTTFAIAITALVLAAVLSAACGGPQAKHPRDLTYPELAFDPPDPADFRAELANGLRVYVQEETGLPVVFVTALVEFGALDAPRDKTGLAAVMSSAYVKGGTAGRDGTAIEDRLDFLGASLTFNAGERTSQLTGSCLSKDLDEWLEIFFDLLRNPTFGEDALRLSRSRLIEGLRQANDAPARILGREFERLIYGDHPLTRQATRATYESVSAADLKAAHGRCFYPKNIILAATGDFAKADLLAKIERLTAGWENGSRPALDADRDFPVPEPGVYFVQRPINQGYVSLGHLGVEDTHPDYPAIQVMNFILGGGSFTSRITAKVRSDEGLSYNQGSRFAVRWGFPGTFSGYVQTKSETVGYAISLIQAEFERIRREPVSDAEMQTAINYYLESFADAFQPPGMMTSFANLEMTGKPRDYYATLRDRLKAVTKEQVMAVANTHVRPGEMVILIVGDRAPCDKGGDKWSGPLDKLGPVREVPLADPMTGAPPK